MISEYTHEELAEVYHQAVAENREIKRLLNKLLWMLRGGEHGYMVPAHISYHDMAAAIEQVIDKQGIKLK